MCIDCFVKLRQLPMRSATLTELAISCSLRIGRSSAQRGPLGGKPARDGKDSSVC